MANGQAMQKILESMDADANLGRKMAAASHTLSKEMKADSIAMKTVGTDLLPRGLCANRVDKDCCCHHVLPSRGHHSGK